MKRLGLCVFLLLCANIAMAEDWKAKLPKKGDVPDYLLNLSVSIAIDNRELGSGTLVAVNVEGKTINFVVTCAHVVKQLRETEEVVDPKSGTKRTIVRFKDCALVKEFREDGRKVGSTNIDCAVMKFDDKEDIAILKVRKKNYESKSIVFYPDSDPPKIATDLLHCGSLAGSLGAHSVTPGMVAQVGRVIDGVGNNKVYDQTTVVATGGSSGGAVVRREDGAYVGMISIGVRTGDNFNFMVPIRRIHEWSKKAGVEWIFNPTVKSPPENKIDELPVEEIGAKFQRADVPAAMPAPAEKDDETLKQLFFKSRNETVSHLDR